MLINYKLYNEIKHAFFIFHFWTLKPPKRPNSLRVWIGQKKYFFNFVI
jgi:hypothetical protein